MRPPLTPYDPRKKKNQKIKSYTCSFCDKPYPSINEMFACEERHEKAEIQRPKTLPYQNEEPVDDIEVEDTE